MIFLFNVSRSMTVITDSPKASVTILSHFIFPLTCNRRINDSVVVGLLEK